jgi:putrescine transport system substrate-binding protein
MTRKRIAILLFAVVLCFFYCFARHFVPDKECVNVYGWYGIIPRSVINDFEKETGITVRYDFYDNNETLEAKLLATNSGYDVVFPSLIPYAARQAAIGVYCPIDEDCVPNIKNIDSTIYEKFKKVVKNYNVLVPIFWGTIGIAIDEDIVMEAVPAHCLDSYTLVFSDEFLSKLHKNGVSFPEEFVDIFPSMLNFLGEGFFNRDLANIKKVFGLCRRLRPFITKFSSTTLTNDILIGEVCVAIGSSDNAWRAIMAGRKIRKKIKFFIPKEGSTLWIDCIGIPVGAPHKKNAEEFIDFLLRPDILARITNHSGVLTTGANLRDKVSSDISEDINIYPDMETMDRLHIGYPCASEKDMNYEKTAIRAWNHVKLNIFTEKSDQ